jgi:hypothetical protein
MSNKGLFVGAAFAAAFVGEAMVVLVAYEPPRGAVAMGGPGHTVSGDNLMLSAAVFMFVMAVLFWLGTLTFELHFGGGGGDDEPEPTPAPSFDEHATSTPGMKNWDPELDPADPRPAA